MNTRRALSVFFALAALAIPARAQTTFSGTLTVYPDWTHQKVAGASTVTESFANFLDWTHTSGTNANQMSAFIRATGTLTNGQDRLFSLAGAATNSFGDVLTFEKVNFMAFAAGTANTDPINIGATGADTAFATWLSDTNAAVVIRPGGFLLLTAPDLTGYNSINGNLRIVNTGTNNATYEIYIGGSE